MSESRIRISKGWLRALLAISAVLVTGALDYVTGPRFAVLMFYLAPVCYGAWFGGRRAGVGLAAASALAWYTAQVLDPTHEFTGWLLIWNAFIGFGVMVISALLTATVAERYAVEAGLRVTQQELESVVRERTSELASANAVLQAEVAERTAAQAKLKQLNETLEHRVAERSAAAEARARELSQSESTLRRQTGILQSILNSIGDGVVVSDASGCIVLFNPAAERLLKLDARQIGVPLTRDAVPAPLAEAPSCPWAAPLIDATGGKVVDGAEVLIRENGGQNHAWLSATGRPLVDEVGKSQGAVVVYRDVTSHKLLEKQIIEISDREQCRLGQELHDGLCQHLVGMAFAAELLRENMAARQLPETARAAAISDMINQSITQARHLARGLYPVRLEIDGLASALEELAQRTRSFHSIDCAFHSDAPALIPDTVAGFNLFRIAQESVNNAIKHARCTRITISLDAVEDEVTLAVVDNGVGVANSGARPDSMGLHIMHYRAQMIGAYLDIRRGIGGGTVVTCSYRNENRAK